MYPSFPNIYVEYATSLSFKLFRTSDKRLLATLTKGPAYLYNLSFPDAGTRTLVTSTPSLSADVTLAADWLNSSDSSDGY
jgi:hypothetical protein